MIIGADSAGVDGNSRPDYALAKRSMPIGVDLGFVIMRGTYGILPDTTFQRDWKALGETDLVRGVYLFLRHPQRIGDGGGAVVPQVEAFIKLVAPVLRANDLPPILDVEFTDGDDRRHALARVSNTVIMLHNNFGVAPIIYTSARVWHEDLGNASAAELASSPLWLAKPWPWALRTKAQLAPVGLGSPTETAHGTLAPWGDADNWWLHQYQGDAVGFPGFDHTVDINRFHTMQIGAQGDRVRWVQRRLGVPVDGAFGPKTDAALRVFQQRLGLSSDGIIGPKTFVKLCWG